MGITTFHPTLIMIWAPIQLQWVVIDIALLLQCPFSLPINITNIKTSENKTNNIICYCTRLWRLLEICSIFYVFKKILKKTKKCLGDIWTRRLFVAIAHCFLLVSPFKIARRQSSLYYIVFAICFWTVFGLILYMISIHCSAHI